MVFEKLSQAGIELGMDIITAYGSRDLFIKKTELSNTLDEILQVRDSAIVYYTSEVNKVITLHLSPFISCNVWLEHEFCFFDFTLDDIILDCWA